MCLYIDGGSLPHLLHVHYIPIHLSALLAMTSRDGLEGSRNMEEDISMRDERPRDADMANADSLEGGETDLPDLPDVQLPPEVDNLHLNVAGMFHQLKDAYDALRTHTLLLHVEMRSKQVKRIELEAN